MEKLKGLIFGSLGGILDRYLTRSFLRIMVISLLCTTALYLIVDFFDRIDSILKAGAPVWTAIRYFLYKLPLLISRVFGFAVLFSTLFSIGMLSRSQEITAMRANGLSVYRISLPLFITALLICALNFVWNEALVPAFTRESQYIYKTQVKKKEPKSLLGTKDMWVRSEEAFISVDRFDTKNSVLEGVTIFLLNRDFTLKGFIEVPSARWDGTRWQPQRSVEWVLLSNGGMDQREGDVTIPISETPEDLKLLARDPEEFSFLDLKKQIADLQGKGIDATEQKVDLQVKMAVPFVSLLMVVLAIPFATRYRRGGGLTLSFGLTMLIGFGYWFLLAFSISLGHSGAIPAWVAAWIPNVTVGMVGLFFYSAAEE
ncbi:MAG TPA: LPS export ABC transporter permease LptG [Candidatus Binatia bacterium]|jgi:lipopolysaccharide export system permease protein